MTFAERLRERTLSLNTRLCLGLDPRPEWHPQTAPGGRGPAELAQAVERHVLETLEAVAPFVACVKPQVAFFEVLGLEGLAALDRVTARAGELGLPVILDAKRGDIASTGEAYARAWLSGPRAGCALTVNPYLGFDTLAPFLDEARRSGGAVFVLVKTSNPGSADLQDRPLAEGGSVSQVVAAHLAGLAAVDADFGPVGAVVGATHPAQLGDYRARLPRVTLLLPGLGAQGASAGELAPAFDARGLGAVASASRAIHYASRGPDFAQAAAEAARGFRDELNAAISSFNA
ncbi:MAG TPA: orotidine-5'-phosphate decarboxylase [Deinococcales bacterium]|nr:orotidine-5'-phosphate decarboxylase [Deinococcales bacterium]